MCALPSPVAELAPQVQLNCRRSDAATAGRFSLCGLLMRLRNLSKWEKGLAPWREQEPGRVLEWVSRREEAWLELEGQPPQPLQFQGRRVDPFDCRAVNQKIVPLGYIYGAGLAGGLAPVFFLAHLESSRPYEGMTVHRLGRELTQDIFFLPGLRQGSEVFLRRWPLAYLLWDKIADPRRSLARFLHFGLAGYGLSLERVLSRPDWDSLEPVLAGEQEAVLWHELGEAGDAGPALEPLRLALERHPGSDLEHFVRGVKDLMADTGPRGRLARIIQARARGALGLYPAWLGGFPRLLFPEIDAAVSDFIRDGDWRGIDEVRRLGWERARRALERIIPYLEDQGDPEKLRRTARRQVIGPLTGGRRTGIGE